MILVETYSDETEGDFRAAVDGLLANDSVPPRRTWWRPYEVRGLYEWKDVRFREFFCAAYSVGICLWQIARDGGKRRVILLPSAALVMYVEPTMVGRGEEVPVSAADVTAARP
jgi:hypothetical protein